MLKQTKSIRDDNDSRYGDTFPLTELRPYTPRTTINAFSDDRLNCPLCHNRFKQPKSLSCLHSFCSGCLEDYIESLPGGKKFIPCPVCRELNPIPAIGLRNLRSTMSSRAESVALRSESNALRSDSMALVRAERRCDPCFENDESAVAISFCPICRESLCEQCTKSHRGMKITKRHALSDIEDVKESPARFLASSDMCPDHRGKTLDLFCQDHQYAVCSSCVAISHRRCDTVLTVDKAARSMRTKKTTRGLAQRLRLCLSTVDNILAAKETAKKRIKARKEGVLDEVAKLKYTVMQLLDELEDKMRDEVDNTSQESEELLQNKIERNLNLRDAIQGTLSTLETALETSASDYHHVLTMQALKEEADRYENMVDEERLEDRAIELVFTPDEALLRFTKLVDRFGTVELGESKETQARTFRNCNAQKDGIINGKIKSDKQSSIFNSVDITENGDIIVSDYNNFSVKLFDQHGMFRSNMKFNTPPRGICAMPDKQCAVSLPEECIIKFLSTEGRYFSHVKELNTAFKSYRITGLRSKILGIIYAKSCRSLALVTKEGRIERTITRKRDFKGLGGVAYDAMKNYMFMSDRDALTCFNGTGKQVFRNTYRRTDLRGMSMDAQGNIYVCSHDSGQILQISPDGVLIKAILVPLSPQDVAVEPMGNKMVVVGLGDIIHVYKLT